MIKFAIVEDEQGAIDWLKAYFDRYSAECDVGFQIDTFLCGTDFLKNYDCSYDAVFMDVDMPEINGFEAAKRLRKADANVLLIFVTNLARYAIKGYEFNAFNYILKSTEYPTMKLKLRKIVNACTRDRNNSLVRIATSGGLVLVDPATVYYVEIMRHKIIYHTQNGDHVGYGTMKEVEALLPKHSFYRCNSCYLVNLKYVKMLSGYTVLVGDATLTVSHPKKKGFVESLHRYNMGGGYDK